MVRPTDSTASCKKQVPLEHRHDSVVSSGSATSERLVLRIPLNLSITSLY